MGIPERKRWRNTKTMKQRLMSIAERILQAEPLPESGHLSSFTNVSSLLSTMRVQ
jgi:hypothetical protein